MKLICQHLLIIFLLGLVSACNHPSVSLSQPDSNLPLHLEAPTQIGKWTHQASLQKENQTQLIRYQHQANPTNLIDFTIYPLAPGWETLPQDQALQRHYNLLSQQLAKRFALKHDAERVEIKLVELTDDTTPTLVSELIPHQASQKTPTLIILLSIEQNNFVRVTSVSNLANKTKRLTTMKQLRQALLAHAAHQ